MLDEPLHIAMVCLHTSPLEEPGGADAGGMNVVVLEQALALARRGHRVDLFTRRSDPASPAVVEVAGGVRLHHLPAEEPTPLAKSDMDRTIAPFREALRPLLASGGPDVIHSHHWFSGVAALPLARELGLPHLQSFHSVAAPEGSAGLAAGEPAESVGRIPGERLVALESDLIIAVSEAEAATVRERYEVPEEHITVVRPGVDTDRFHPREDAAIRRHPPTLLFTARLQPLKAPDLALEVLSHLDPALGARLVLTGSASQDFADHLEQLRRLAAELGVADRVDMVGSLGRDALAETMRSADALLLTSWSETFGLVALEAQASGIPVVAWDGAGGVREAIAPGGIVLDSRDPAAWAEAVQSLLGDPAEYARAVTTSREFATTRTWDASARALSAVYAEAADARRRRP